MMPGFSDDMKNAILIDYSELNNKISYLKNFISNKSIKIKSELGTDVQFNLGQRKIEIDNGGQLGNIPAGEIFTAPLEDTVNGTIVVDGSISGLGKVNYPFCIELKSGQIIDIQPIGIRDEIVDKFKKICELDLPATKNIGEFGIGLNPGAKIIGNILMDEKVEGTVHFAFGDSYGLGKWKSRYHTDLLIKDPSIFADDKCIMKKGKLTINI
jgi:leucyl aminopeptidase (aminopeptidase T)